MTIKEQIAQMQRQCEALRELREALTEPWEVEPERSEVEELRAQLQHQAALLQRIAQDAEPVDGSICRTYELVLDAETMASVVAAAKYPLTLPTVAIAAAERQNDSEECPF